ncbi:hypothetical protein BJY01DRAFT_153672 [Aspergillus pseudoustus]|uniref:PCI domain-containing protein n=1 Tax=Aspergillus pseudoustus TaxID=1810923 RepID=A0ABR4K8B0_9EURO
MDQVHHRAMDALQPFVHLADSGSASSPRFVANIITNATSSPHTYVFAELLERPAVQALRAPDAPAELQGYLTLLEIFAWGTWQDYQQTPNLPALSDEQARKLRLLSLISLASTIKPLTYESLMTSLSLSAPSDLETLVTTAIYSSLITARLSPATTPPTVNVTSVAALRDVKPTSLPSIISTLMAWESRCGSVITGIEQEIAKIRLESARRRTSEHTRMVVIEKTLAKWNPESGEAITSGGGPAGRGVSSTRKSGWKKDISAALRGRDFFGGGSNKREFDDDAFFEENANEVDALASGMDIDEGAGARTGLGNAGARTAKRFLGKKS